LKKYLPAQQKVVGVHMDQVEILDRLNDEYGGYIANIDDSVGATEQFHAATSQLAQLLSDSLMPAFTWLIKAATQFVRAFVSAGVGASYLGAALGSITVFVQPAIDASKALWDLAKAIADWDADAYYAASRRLDAAKAQMANAKGEFVKLLREAGDEAQAELHKIWFGAGAGGIPKLDVGKVVVRAPEKKKGDNAKREGQRAEDQARKELEDAIRLGEEVREEQRRQVVQSIADLEIEVENLAAEATSRISDQSEIRVAALQTEIEQWRWGLVNATDPSQIELFTEAISTATEEIEYETSCWKGAFDETRRDIVRLQDEMRSMAKQGVGFFANSVSKAFADMAGGAKQTGKQVVLDFVAMIGQMAQQMGTLFLLASMGLIVMPGMEWRAPYLAAAGAGLIAFGGIMQGLAQAGQPKSESSAGDYGMDSDSMKDLEERNQNKYLHLEVHGSILGEEEYIRNELAPLINNMVQEDELVLLATDTAAQGSMARART